MQDSETVSMTSGVTALLPFARPARGRLLLAAGLGFGSAVLELAPFWFVYRAVDDLVSSSGTADRYAAYAIAAVVCVIGRFLLFGLAMYVSHVSAYRILYDLRIALAERLARVPLGSLSRRRSGEIQQVMGPDVERLELFLAHAIPDLGAALGAWTLLTVWLGVVDWRMLLASIVLVPIAFVFLSRAMQQASEMTRQYYESEARMNGTITEYVRGMAVVKVFNRGGTVIGETARTIRDYTRFVVAYSTRFLPLGTAFFVLVGAGIAIVVPVGSWLYLSGRIDLPTYLFFCIVGIGYALPIMKLFMLAAGLQHLTFGGHAVQAMLEAAPLPEAEGPVELTDHTVRFDAVAFAYEDRRVVDGVSFVAPAGTVTALVGPSGSGKTTIAKLIPRFFDAEAGVVSIGGIDVRDIPTETLMQTVSFVFQDSFLFDDTIEANIRIGRADATPAEVEAAARAAAAHDFITALPQGYQSPVGEVGSRLSGGEKQRIAIARAILHDAPVVVLDEATAFADPENERALQEALSRLVEGKTLVMIAHRLTTVAGADQILVIDRGRVAERGTHATLLDDKGLYAQLWEDDVAADHLALGRRVRGDVSPLGPRSRS